MNIAAVLLLSLFGPASTPPTGHGSGLGQGSAIGSFGTGSFGGRRVAAPVPKADLVSLTVKGRMHQAIVRRYVRRHLTRIRFCYERELIKTPGLGGNMAVRFEIAITGLVVKPVARGVSNEVADCVASTIGRIEFPRPTDLIGVKLTLRFAPPHPP